MSRSGAPSRKDRGDQQAAGVGEDMALAAFDLLARVTAAGSVVLTRCHAKQPAAANCGCEIALIVLEVTRVPPIHSLFAATYVDQYSDGWLTFGVPSQ
jgi:hypothetical protein